MIKLASARKFTAILANISLLFNSFVPLLLAAQPVYAQDATPTTVVESTPTPTPDPTVTETPAEPTAIPTEAPIITPIVTENPTITPIVTDSPTISPTVTVEPTAIPTATPSSTITPEPTPTQVPSLWTFEKVELNKEYIAPQNSGVKLTFTKLPTTSGNIKIEEITLTKEQIQQTGSLSDKAYDITSDMKDGEFSYNLSLPIPEASKGKAVEVKFAEELSGIVSAAKVENTLTKTDTSVSVASLDHFTIFYVTLDPATCTGGVYSGVCYATIQAAINAAAPDGIIYVAAGDYTENLNINKSITLNGPNVGVVGDRARAPEARILNSTISFSGSNTIVMNGFHIYTTKNDSDVVMINANTAVTLTNSKIERVGATAGDIVRAITTAIGSTANVQITNNLFTGDTSGGLYNGHKTWNSAIYSNGGTNINITGNVFENSRTALNLDNFSAGVTVSGNTFKNSGTYISFGGTTPTVGQYTISGNNFETAIDTIFNLSNVADTFRINATGNTFLGKATDQLSLAESFAIEASMYHRGRSGRNGLVTYVAGKQFVITANPSIQRAIDKATSGDTINVAAGTYKLDSQIRISKGNNIIGAGDLTVITTGSTPWTNSTGSRGYASLIMVVSGNEAVKLENFKVMGAKTIAMSPSGTDYGSGINVVSSSNVTLKNITLISNEAAGLIVNSSNVTADNLNTSLNGWYGVNVDKQDSVDANFTLTGNGNISEPVKIYSDNTVGVSVNADGYSPHSIGTTATYWSKDIALPTAPTNLTPVNNTFTNNSSFSNTWSAVNGAVGYEYQTSYSANGSTLGSIIYSDSSAAKPDRYDLTGNIIVRTNITAQDANYNWQVRAINADGKPGVWSEIYKVTVDTTNPNFTITSPSLNQVIMGRTVTINGTATDTNFNYYYCYVSNVNGHEYGARDASCTTTWHAVIPASVLGSVTLPNDLPDGNYVVHLLGYDKAMNSAETTQSFVLDNTAPTIPSLLTPIDGGYEKANDFYFNWNASSDVLSVTYEYQASLKAAEVNGILTTDLWHSGVLPSNTIHSSGASDGVWYWQVRAIDAVGNKSAWTSPWKMTIDSQVPTLAISGPITGSTLTDYTLNIEGSVADPNFNYYYCYVTDANGEVGVRNPQCKTAWWAGAPFHSAFAQTVTGTSDGHLGSVNLAGLLNGTYQVHLVAYDKAGNSTEASVQFTLSKAAPATLNLISFNTSTSSDIGGVVLGAASAPVCNDQKPSSAPILLSADAGANSVTLTWSVASNPTSYYLVTYGDQPGSQQYGNPNVGPAGTTSYTVKSLSGNTTYYFKVRAGNGCTPGDFSNELSAATTAQGQFIAAPAAGFQAGVLGAQTTATPTTTISATNTANKDIVNIGDILGTQKTASKGFDWRWLGLLLIPAAGILIYSRRRSD